jgi:hypothetical protein
VSSGNGITRVGDWKKAERILASTPTELKAAIGAALKAEGEYLVGKVKQRIRTGPFAPLSPLTIAARRMGTSKRPAFGGSKPLISSGDMRNSVTAFPKSPTDSVFIGILRTAQGSNGTKLYNIAKVHEEGKTIAIAMTPKMRSFLFGVLFKKAKSAGTFSGGGGSSSRVLVVHIPARPFIAPTFEEHTKGSGDRILATVARLLGGKLGK